MEALHQRARRCILAPGPISSTGGGGSLPTLDWSQVRRSWKAVLRHCHGARSRCAAVVLAAPTLRVPGGAPGLSSASAPPPSASAPPASSATSQRSRGVRVSGKRFGAVERWQLLQCIGTHGTWLTSPATAVMSHTDAAAAMAEAHRAAAAKAAMEVAAEEGSEEGAVRCCVLGCKEQLLQCNGLKHAGCAYGCAESPHVVCAPCLGRWFSSQAALRAEKGLPKQTRRTCPVCQVELRASGSEMRGICGPVCDGAEENGQYLEAAWLRGQWKWSCHLRARDGGATAPGGGEGAGAAGGARASFCGEVSYLWAGVRVWLWVGSAGPGCVSGMVSG